MSSAAIFQTHLVLGYVAWLLCFLAYGWPRLKAMDPIAAHRAIATLHSFRFFGLVFIMPGVVAPDLPPHFSVFAAYADLATGLLAMLALVTVRIPLLFWGFVVAFNLVGAVDFLLDYFHAIEVDLPDIAGELGVAYIIPVLVVPVLMITHIAAFTLLWRSSSKATARALP